jgi:hypothetical protein
MLEKVANASNAVSEQSGNTITYAGHKWYLITGFALFWVVAKDSQSSKAKILKHSDRLSSLITRPTF